eukprot:jgi/Chlat1/4851/Chrsp31S04881
MAATAAAALPVWAAAGVRSCAAFSSSSTTPCASSSPSSRPALKLRVQSPCARQRALSSSFPSRRVQRAASFTVRAEKDSDTNNSIGSSIVNGLGGEAVQTALRLGKTGVDFATNLVPEAVPRPVAKAGVALVGVSIVWSILQSVVQSIITLTVLGGLGYFAYQNFGPGFGGSNSSFGGKTPAEEREALEEARRIMDKYK